MKHPWIASALLLCLVAQPTWARPRKQPLSGFAWESFQTKQVVYLTPDGHVHELSIKLGGRWGDADLTRLTGAPAADLASPLSGFAWESFQTKQVVYLTPDGHVHELYIKLGAGWKDADLTTLTGAPAVDLTTPLSAFAWESFQTKQVVYLTPDGHVHELSIKLGGRWGDADLTKLTGAPAANLTTSLSGFAWESFQTKQVVYLTPDGHVHELSIKLGGRWGDADLTKLTNAPPAG
jgi:hypothetical protein